MVEVDADKTETAHAKYEHLIARAKLVPATKTIVVHPCDETSLRGALEAADESLIVPILVDPIRKIRAVADEYGLDIGRFELSTWRIAMPRPQWASNWSTRRRATC